MIKTDVTLRACGYIAEFRSDLGGNCYRLCHEASGAELRRSPCDEKQLFSEIFLFGNAILFPPNRIRGGEFEFEGRHYAFPVNEKATGCHLHGELYKTPFCIAEKTDTRVKFFYTAKAGEYLGFPHAFKLWRTYTLSEDGMEESVTVTNLSEKNMPFMLAFHTTFNAPFISGSKTEDCFVKVAVGREHIRHEKYLPTLEYVGGRERELLMNSGDYPVAAGPLSAFYSCTGRDTTITDRKSGKRIVYESDSDYGYRMLWRKDGAPYFVAEPQTSAIDCFHLEAPAEEKGLITVAPGESKTLITKFKIEDICKL